MRWGVLIVGATLPLAASILVWGISARPDSDPQVGSGNSADTGEVPSWVQEPIRFAPDPEPGTRADSPDFVFPNLHEEVAKINSALKASITENFDQEIEAQLNRAFREEENVVLQALPGLPGYVVAICPRSQNCLNQQLLEEPDNPAWARQMEVEIAAALASRRGSPVAAHIACRSSICGIVLPSGAVHLNVALTATQLGTKLGFSSFYVAVDSPDLQAIYVTTGPPDGWFGILKLE